MKVWQVTHGFKSQPPQCHPKLFSAANSLHWATLSQNKNKFNFAYKTFSVNPAPARQQQDFQTALSQPLREFYLVIQAHQFTSQHLTPSPCHSLLQGNNLNSTVLQAETNKHKSIQNALLSISGILQTSLGLNLKDFDPQLCGEKPGGDNTYRKKAKNSLTRKELIRKTAWAGGLLVKLSVTPAPC